MPVKRTRLILGLIATAILLVGGVARAQQDDGISQSTAEPMGETTSGAVMPPGDDSNLLYLSLSGSFVVTPPSGAGDLVVAPNTKPTEADKSFGGGVDIGYRFGSFGLETGVHVMKQSWLATYDVGSSKVHEIINYGYIAVPAVVKWNYIETRLSTFYVKGGMSLDFASSRSNEDLIPVQFVSGLAGIGGTAELNEHAAFLLDIGAVQHFGFDSQPPIDGVISAGFLIAL